MRVPLRWRRMQMFWSLFAIIRGWGSCPFNTTHNKWVVCGVGGHLCPYRSCSEKQAICWHTCCSCCVGAFPENVSSAIFPLLTLDTQNKWCHTHSVNYWEVSSPPLSPQPLHLFWVQLSRYTSLETKTFLFCWATLPKKALNYVLTLLDRIADIFDLIQERPWILLRAWRWGLNKSRKIHC